MIEITPSRLEQARASREVATALSLFLSGKLRPRLMRYGSAVRMALSRVDPNDSGGLAEIFSDAALFAQICESRILGGALPNPEKFTPGVQSALARAIACADLWRPVVASLTAVLLRYGLVTCMQIATISELGNTGGGRSTGERLRKPQPEKEFQS